MSEQLSREGTTERFSRFWRNVHGVIGGGALLLAGVFPPAGVVGAWEVAHAAGWEAVRRGARNHRAKNSPRPISM